MMTAFTLSLVCRWWWWWWWWYPEYLPTERIPIGIRSVGILGVCQDKEEEDYLIRCKMGPQACIMVWPDGYQGVSSYDYAWENSIHCHFVNFYHTTTSMYYCIDLIMIVKVVLVAIFMISKFAITICKMQVIQSSSGSNVSLAIRIGDTWQRPSCKLF